MKIKESSPELAAVSFALKSPEIGQFRAARELQSQGFRLSPSGVRAIWKRNGLATAYDRLMARRRQTGAELPALSESQKSLLQRARLTKRLFSEKGGDAGSASEVRREQLVIAAARVFNTKGYEAASLREICASAGILAGSLYYHFRSKEDLFVTVHAEGFRELNELVDRTVSAHADPWRRLETACEAHLALLVSGTVISSFTVESLFHTMSPALQRRLSRDRNAYEERYRTLIEALPLPREVDRTLLRLALLGALNWTRVWYRPGKKTPAQIAQHLVQTLVRRAAP